MKKQEKKEKTLKDKLKGFALFASELVSYVLPKKQNTYFNGGQSESEEAFIGYPQIVQGSGDRDNLRFRKTLNERNRKHFGFY